MVVTPIKINAKSAQIGMYVSKLDRPLEQTPFSIEGFYVRDLNEVKQLGLYCDFIFIDSQKGIAPEAVSGSEKKEPLVYRGKLKSISANPSIYPEVEPLKKEITLAQTVYQQLVDEIDQVMNQVQAEDVVSLKPLLKLVYAMVDSMVRNPDAFIWFVRVRKMEGSPYYYLLRSASFVVLFARHLGLARNDLRALAISLLLRDIGLFSLPKDLRKMIIGEKLNSQKKSTSIDPAIGKMIVDKTVEQLKTFAEIPPKSIKIIKMYRERLNGTGYPQQIKGDEIYSLAKIAGLVVFYDEVSYLAGKKCAIAISKSVSRLYKVRGIYFQSDLIAEFIKAVGLYPTGTLVKLSNDKIAIVAEQNYEFRLKPKVILLLDEHGEEYKKYQFFDLYSENQRKKALINSGKKREHDVDMIDIVEDIEPYDYPIKVSKIRQQLIPMLDKKSLRSFFRW